MTKKLVNCPVCGKQRWAKAKKDKPSREIYVDILDKYCVVCKNRMRQNNMKRKPRLSEIPEKFNQQITMRELWTKEMDRRGVTAKAEKARVSGRK